MILCEGFHIIKNDNCQWKFVEKKKNTANSVVSGKDCKIRNFHQNLCQKYCMMNEAPNQHCFVGEQIKSLSVFANKLENDVRAYIADFPAKKRLLRKEMISYIYAAAHTHWLGMFVASKTKMELIESSPLALFPASRDASKRKISPQLIASRYTLFCREHTQTHLWEARAPVSLFLHPHIRRFVKISKEAEAKKFPTHNTKCSKASNGGIKIKERERERWKVEEFFQKLKACSC